MTREDYFRAIRKVWVLDNPHGVSIHDTGPLVGDGSFELIFVTGQGYHVTHDKDRSHCPTGIYLGGQLDKPLSVEILPYSRLTFFKLEPWAASLLFDFDFRHALNRTIPVAELNPALYQTLSNYDWHHDHESIAEVLRKTFEQRLNQQSHFDLIRHGCRVLESHYYDFSEAKSDLMDLSGLSARSLEQKLRSSIGVTPKKYANMIRMRKVAEDIYHGQVHESLTELALKHGYYDQAHFIRDCRKYLGLSPKQITPAQVFLTDPEEAFRFYTIS